MGKIKEVELKALQVEVAEKLEQMIEGEKEAKIQKAGAIELGEQVAEEMVVIAARTEEVNAELEGAGPALEAAAEAVKGIKKKQLDEVRAFKKPPPKVVM